MPSRSHSRTELVQQDCQSVWPTRIGRLYSTQTAGDDLELVVRLHRTRPAKSTSSSIKFAAGAICWTEAPESLKVLGAQGRRWQRGGIQTLILHRDMFWTRKDARIGWCALGQMLFFDLLSPLAETLGYLTILPCAALGLLSVDHAAAFLAVVFAFGSFIGISALTLKRMLVRRFDTVGDLFVLSIAALLENFGYRQLNTLWRIQGLIKLARGKSGWGVATARTGVAARQRLHS